MASLPGAGAHRFWGFSPALDLLAEAADAHDDPETPRRFLLLSPGDPRHILRTLGALAKRRGAAEQADAPTLEFSVYEQAPELLARHLLLLSVALDFELPRRERASAMWRARPPRPAWPASAAREAGWPRLAALRCRPLPLVKPARRHSGRSEAVALHTPRCRAAARADGKLDDPRENVA